MTRHQGRGGQPAPSVAVDGAAGRSPQWTEFGLLLFAFGITAVGWWTVDQAVYRGLTPRAGPYLGGYVGLWLAAHLLLRRLAPRADWLLLPSCALLNGIGLVMIHRIDLAQHAQFGAAAATAAPQQLLWTRARIGWLRRGADRGA